ncbi:MAG TPA: SMC-Scp complex subunit ScpB [Ruminococcaceae bacterium]|nr:SMC-Scp complex subunit ScpB [Oscillospiraceae bacterium]
MTVKELIPAFEAVLFSGGEPLSIERFSQVFDITPETVTEVMEQLSAQLDKNNRGIKLLRMENTYQLATKEAYAEYIKKAFDIKRRTPLSPAALEVLAVIAYNQPVTKSFIEQVRGVDCSGVVTTLVEKGLVEERGRLELPGRPLLYGTTKNFLRCFSMSDLSELPPLPKNENAENRVAEQLPLEEETE